MFVAVARIPSTPSAIQRAATISGLAVADASRFLAGTLPRILLRAALNGGRIVAELEAAGFVAFAADESEVITDQQRVVARNLELSDEDLVALDGTGRREACAWSEVRTILRGIRLVETTEVTQSSERKLALGKALITGGLAVTKKVQTVTERTTAAKEGFLLLQRDGRPEILLAERRLNYQCLGKEIQPSTHGNLMALFEWLKTSAPHAAVDDRITRPGFLAGLPALALDPVDLAIFLVTRARIRGC